MALLGPDVREASAAEPSPAPIPGAALPRPSGPPPPPPPAGLLPRIRLRLLAQGTLDRVAPAGEPLRAERSLVQGGVFLELIWELPGAPRPLPLSRLRADLSTDDPRSPIP